MKILFVGFESECLNHVEKKDQFYAAFTLRSAASAPIAMVTDYCWLGMVHRYSAHFWKPGTAHISRRRHEAYIVRPHLSASRVTSRTVVGTIMHVGAASHNPNPNPNPSSPTPNPNLTPNPAPAPASAKLHLRWNTGPDTTPTCSVRKCTDGTITPLTAQGNEKFTGTK